MSKRNVLTLVIFLLIISATQMVTFAQESNETAELDAKVAYGLRGQYPVGTRDISDNAPLAITIWYPALGESDTEEVTVYPYETNPDMSMGMNPTVTGHSISDAPMNLESGPYPLVVLSHGYSLGRTAYAWLAENLASHGFVVVAPQHYELVDETLSDFWRAAITRPQEIVTVLDFVEEQSEVDGIFEGAIDTDLVAVVGHSYGGYTSLVMAGARFDIDGMEALCDAAEEASDPNAWLCGMVLPYIEDMAELAGLNEIPDALWPTWGDERVDVIVSMAGDAYFFNEAGLAEVTIPVMAIGGTGDTGTPYAWGTQPTYDYISSTSKVRVGLQDAEHMVFGATCDALPWFTEIDLEAYCSDPVWNMDEAHTLINHFATAFLLAELKQDPDGMTALSPDTVDFSNVIYDAQGY